MLYSAAPVYKFGYELVAHWTLFYTQIQVKMVYLVATV